MLTSIDKETNERVYAEDATKGREYICPDCGSPLILKQGRIKIPHFAHKEDNPCIFRSGGEGFNHDLMKKVVKEILDKHNTRFKSEFEYRFDNGRIADICFYDKRNKIAIECVDKHTDFGDFMDKLRSYKKSGIKSMWIFDLKRFQDEHGNIKPQVRVNEIMKKDHYYNYGKIWAVDTENKQLYAIHLDTAYSERFYYDDFYTVALKATKNIKYSLQKNLRLWISDSSIVGPFCKKFW